ncbi:SDR family NAD(P)-dependent oxidoreductase [Mycobacterium sp. WMMD1722]|uniref:SDR family NAD(P)-dependent oxidoreductase n=1 Tax=Mycobacterium sp. WMMD1722 TaxID=3404117 RepID=UPI003BF4F48E
MKLTGNTALITGGGTGIGRALAVALHRSGNRVVITGRRPGPLRAVADAHPGIEWHPLDVADPESIRRLALTVQRRWPDLDVLISNAGVMTLDGDGTSDPALAAAVVATNLVGPIMLTSALLPILRDHPDSTIVNITSALAFVPLAAAAAYCASKAGLHSYTESLRIMLQPDRIQVIEIAPPRVRTDMDGPVGADSMTADDFVAEVLEALSAQPQTGEVVVDAARAVRFAERDGRYDQMLTAVNTPARTEDAQ